MNTVWDMSMSINLFTMNCYRKGETLTADFYRTWDVPCLSTPSFQSHPLSSTRGAFVLTCYTKNTFFLVFGTVLTSGVALVPHSYPTSQG